MILGPFDFLSFLFFGPGFQVQNVRSFRKFSNCQRCRINRTKNRRALKFFQKPAATVGFTSIVLLVGKTRFCRVMMCARVFGTMLSWSGSRERAISPVHYFGPEMNWFVQTKCIVQTCQAVHLWKQLRRLRGEVIPDPIFDCNFFALRLILCGELCR